MSTSSCLLAAAQPEAAEQAQGLAALERERPQGEARQMQPVEPVRMLREPAGERQPDAGRRPQAYGRLAGEGRA